MAADPLAEIREREAEPLPAALEPGLAGRAWGATWPKLAAIGLVLGIWQLVVWSGWKPDYVLPGPLPVLARLGGDLRQADFYAGVLITLRRAVEGYLIANAHVPLSEMFGYSTDLRSATQGKGEYSMEFAKYQPVPRSTQEQMIKEFREKLAAAKK